MKNVILDLGNKTSEASIDGIENYDLLISQYRYASLPGFIKLVEFKGNFELFNLLKRKDIQSREKLIIFYDGKKFFPLLLQISIKYGYFRTRMVFGSNSYLFHIVLIYELVHYFFLKICKLLPHTPLHFPKKNNSLKGVKCNHLGLYLKKDTFQGKEPNFIVDKAQDDLYVDLPFFSPTYYRQVGNIISTRGLVEELKHINLHTQTDGLGRGAYIFHEDNSLNKFPYFYLKESHAIHPLNVRNLYGTWVNLTCFSEGYAHWILDALPAIYHSINELKKNGKIKLIVNSWSDFKQDSLSPLNLGEIEIMVVRTAECLYVENLLNLIIPINKYAILNGFRPHPRKSYLKLMTDSLIKKSISYGALCFNSKIYIVRKRNTERSVANEKKLIARLVTEGFVAIDLEKLSLLEQVKLFQSVRIVVAAHGAGLSNIIFSQNVKVVELMHPHIVRSHFFHICKDWGFDYKVIIGRTLFNLKTKSFKIDIESVVRKIEEF
jgi:hypothetical protein